MATTWIKPIHKSKSKSVFATLADSIGYADNPNKTHDYEYVKSYGCDYYTAANEWALSRQLYEQQTGRSGCKGDILAYHVRQSFKPGEITPEAALEVGYALMEKFTHSRHQFVVAVHTDKQHIHCHCIFNAVNIDTNGKFRNPIGSTRIVRRISDYLCVERGLSIIENPKKSRGSYCDWQDKKEPQTNRDKLMELIDNNISAGMMFEQFIAVMADAGCEVKRGKYLSFKIPGAERFIRVKSLGNDYTEQALRERCTGKRLAPKHNTSTTNVEKFNKYIASPQRPSLLIDIQAKIQQGAGDGYVQWMRIFNLKTAARTLIFLKEQGIDSYDELKAKCSSASSKFSKLSHEIRDLETKQKDISELQKHIGTYIKTRATYEAYRKGGQKQKYYDEHATDIILHRAAKNYFNEQGFKGKLPSIATLKQEWATFDSEKKLLYKEYHEVKDKHKELQTALMNADNILGKHQAYQREQNSPKKTHYHDAR